MALVLMIRHARGKHPNLHSVYFKSGKGFFLPSLLNEEGGNERGGEMGRRRDDKAKEDIHVA